MHSIDELKRQHKVAESKYQQAKEAYTSSRQRLNEALASSTGLVGKIAVGSRYKIRVTTVVFWGDKAAYAKGPKIKKDGSDSSVQGQIYISENFTVEPEAAS